MAFGNIKTCFLKYKNWILPDIRPKNLVGTLGLLQNACPRLFGDTNIFFAFSTLKKNIFFAYEIMLFGKINFPIKVCSFLALHMTHWRAQIKGFRLKISVCVRERERELIVHFQTSHFTKCKLNHLALTYSQWNKACSTEFFLPIEIGHESLRPLVFRTKGKSYKNDLSQTFLAKEFGAEEFF